MAVSTFIAKSKSPCDNCDDGIFPGEEIAYVAGAYTHVDCSPDLKVEHPVCDVCWLTHPKGACDR